MKTMLKFLSLFSAASVPSALAVEIAGVHLPAGIDALDAFCGFVIALVALIALGDYSRTASAAAPSAARTATSASRIAPKASHPFAA